MRYEIRRVCSDYDRDVVAIFHREEEPGDMFAFTVPMETVHLTDISDRSFPLEHIRFISLSIPLG